LLATTYLITKLPTSCKQEVCKSESGLQYSDSRQKHLSSELHLGPKRENTCVAQFCKYRSLILQHSHAHTCFISSNAATSYPKYFSITDFTPHVTVPVDHDLQSLCLMNWKAAGASVQKLPFPTQTHKEQVNNRNFLQKQIQLIQTYFQYYTTKVKLPCCPQEAYRVWGEDKSNR
jgi:hypothetical protein